MDGSLLDLTAEMVESELEDYWHELFKVQKLLVTKLKKAKVDMMAANRRKSVMDVKQQQQLQTYDEDSNVLSQQQLQQLNMSLNIPLPANSENTVKLITSIQDRMKEFKASILNHRALRSSRK